MRGQRKKVFTYKTADNTAVRERENVFTPHPVKSKHTETKHKQTQKESSRVFQEWLVTTYFKNLRRKVLRFIGYLGLRLSNIFMNVSVGTV